MAYRQAPPTTTSNPLFTESESSALDGFLDSFAASDPLASSHQHHTPAVSSASALPPPPPAPPSSFFHTLPASEDDKKPRTTPYSAGLEHIKAFQPQAYAEHFTPATGAPLTASPRPPQASTDGQSTDPATMTPDRGQRMRKQALELSAWMEARGIQPSSPSLADPAQLMPLPTNIPPPNRTTADEAKPARAGGEKGKAKARPEDKGGGKKEKTLLSNEQKRANHIASEQKVLPRSSPSSTDQQLMGSTERRGERRSDRATTGCATSCRRSAGRPTPAPRPPTGPRSPPGSGDRAGPTRRA